MPQFFISSQNIINNNIIIDKLSDIKHITNVLRLNKGDRIMLAEPGSYVYESEISIIKPDLIETIILNKYKSDKKLNINITLAQSVLKSQKHDFVIQKAVELGVKIIIPFISQNTVVKMESEKDKAQKLSRWQKIAYEASKQCKRIDMPEIDHIIDLNKLIELNNFDIMFACAERKASSSIKEFLLKNKIKIDINSSILVIIGPEGGWSDEELNLFNDNNISLVNLGNLVLRAETAAITAISNIIYEYEL